MTHRKTTSTHGPGMRRWLIGWSLAIMLVTLAGAQADERRREGKGGESLSHRRSGGKAPASGGRTAISAGSGSGLTASPWTGPASVRCAACGRAVSIAAGNSAVNLTDYSRGQINGHDRGSERWQSSDQSNCLSLSIMKA
jgi:hypothetical protein